MAHHFLNILLSSLLYAEPPKGNETNFHWSYKGTTGPNYWGSHYHTCSGTRQSPVDIRDQNIIFQDLPPFQFSGFDGSLCSFVLRNNGHTASISVSGNMTVEGGGLDGKYKTAELHFHWGSSNQFGSEHSINGRKYPLEMHIVNYATKYGSLPNAMRFRDGLAVLGSFFDVARENVNFRPFESGLRKARYVGNFTSLAAINLLGLLPPDTSRYYRYYGSLTTPPCHQSVMWTLFEDVNYLSVNQIQLLRQLYEPSEYEGRDRHGASNHPKTTDLKPELRTDLRLVDNYRPIQPDFDRVINANILRYADPQYIKHSRVVAPKRPASFDILTHSLAKVNIDDLFNKTLHKWLQSKGVNIAQLADVLSTPTSQPQIISAASVGQRGLQHNNRTPARNPGQPLLRTFGNSKSHFDAGKGQKNQPTGQRPLKHNPGILHQRVSGTPRQPTAGTPHQPISGTLRQPVAGTPRQPSSGTSHQVIPGTSRQPIPGTRSQHDSGRGRQIITGIPRNLNSESSHRQNVHGSLRRPVVTSRRPASRPSWEKNLPSFSHMFGSKSIQALSGRTAQDQVTKLEPNASGNQQGVASQTRAPPSTQVPLTIKPTTSPRSQPTRSQNVGNNAHPTSPKPVHFPDTLDLQAIQTYSIDANGEQVEAIQLEVDPTTGISREDLQQLLNNPAIIQQILQIVNSNGSDKNGEIHEILVPLPFQSGDNEQGVQNSPVPHYAHRVRRTSPRFIHLNRYRTDNPRSIYRYSR